MRVRLVDEDADGPAGVDVMASNPFMAEQENSSVVAYRDEDGSTTLGVDALYICRLMLSPEAPERLATVAFGLMAIEAYRRGFGHIALFAAGNGPINPNDPDGFVGFDVWPKFGFDASLSPADLNRAASAALRACKTVQEVIVIDAEWWAEYGRGRDMRFDLTASSRSWSVLLNYLYDVLQFPEIEA